MTQAILDRINFFVEAKTLAFYEKQGIDFNPPASVKKAAERGLKLRKEAPKSNKGGLDTKQAGKLGIGSGVARATQLKSGKKVSPKVIKQMIAFFSRHEKNKDTPKGKINDLLWGGRGAGFRWAKKINKMMEKVDNKS